MNRGAGVEALLARARAALLDRDPTLPRALLPACVLSAVLYTRPPSSGFLFDEPGALLENPYVRAADDRASPIGWLEAFGRDFWGLLPDRTVGTYRPVPNLVWRGLWRMGLGDHGAFPFVGVNVLLHGLNGALLVLLAFRWTRDRLTAWLAGGLFITTAVVTEAVSGVVGLADVLAGTAALLALLALDLPLTRMPVAVFAATTLGLYSKESALSMVALVPLAALFGWQTAPGGKAPASVRAAVAAVATALAFVLYVEVRRRAFPLRGGGLSAAAGAGKPALERAFAALVRWYAQPALLIDPIGNPLASAPAPLRVAGALRVFASGLGQVLVPWTLSADYSAQQELAPRDAVFPGSVAGAAAMLLPVLAAPVVGVVSLRRWRRTHRFEVAPVVAFALLWVVLTYFPVSNIPIALPTVRAERFWSLPAIGSAMALAVVFARLWAAASRAGWRLAAAVFFLAFSGFQAFAARRHALEYGTDLAFWDATVRAAPRSARAHFHRSIALGDSGDLQGRLAENQAALRLAPQWAKALVYQGEVLCRLHRVRDAIPYYVRGFDLAHDTAKLLEFGMRCLTDEHALPEGSPARAALQDLAARRPGTRLAAAVASATQR